jgi:hypothetical protein
MIIIGRTLDEINEKTQERLKEIGLTTSPSGIANLLLSIVNEEIAVLYSALTASHLNSFLSFAEEDYLDNIGYLLNCTREEGETDDRYRVRISNQVLNMASSNETSIRESLMMINGIQDVVIKEFTHGTGSFSVYIVTQEEETPEEIIEKATEIINKSKGLGVKFEVYSPKIVPVELRGRLIFKKEASESEKGSIKTNAVNTIKDMIGRMNLGDLFNPMEIKNEIIKLSDLIHSVDIYHFKFNEKVTTLSPQQLKWNERCVPAKIIDAILIS